MFLDARRLAFGEALFFMNSGVVSGGNTLIARSIGLIAFLTEGGSERFAARKMTPGGRCDASTRRFGPSGI
jgi:hypothetical protein